MNPSDPSRRPAVGLWPFALLPLCSLVALSAPGPIQAAPAAAAPAVAAAPAAAAEDSEAESAPAGAATASWMKPVAGWVPVQAGEHPRLLFRKSDLPALRKRAQTPDGQAILARLKATLGGGEAMPTILNPAKTSYSSDSQSSPELRKEGAYTISHAAGFGFLYQITGDRKYADLAQKCVELAMKGQRDRDDRYSLIGYANDAHLRAAPTCGMYALAYDLCYDAWSPEFRKKFVDTLLNANAETGSDLKKIAIKPNHMPTSNHWGAQVGGVSLVLLALNGDPGVDQKFIDTALPLNEKRLEALFTNGWGDAGWFAESTGPSHVSANSAILPALQAFKNAAGKDYTQRDSVRWMTMRWAYDLFPREGRPAYACRLIGDNLTYGTEDFLGFSNGGGFTHGGWFSQGFGTIPERDKPALLWAYRNYVAKAMGDNYDIRNYPHRAILAFLNWPIGMEPKNPAEVLPKVRVDSLHGYVSFRNRWSETGDDIVVSVWSVSGPRGWIGRKGPGQPGASHGDVGIWAYGGRRVGMGKMIGAKPTVVWQNPDGSGQVTCKNATLAVDFSGKSGSDALLVGIALGIQNGLNPQVRAVTRGLMLGDKKVYVGSINKTGIHPEPRLDPTGSKIIVGGQTVSLVDGKFSFVPATPEEAAGGGTIDANKAVAAERLKIAQNEKRNEPKPEEIVMPSDPPVFAYGFESIEKEGAAQVFRDSSPNKLTLRVKGAPVSLKDGPVGKAVLLNGADNALIIDPNPAIDMADKNLTLVHWFKNETTEGGVEWVLVEKNTWQGKKAPDCYSTCVDSAGNYGFNTPNSSAFAREPIPWSDGKWHCVATVFDATNQKTYHYFDGKLISSKGIAVHGPIGPGSAPLTIGARGAEKTANHFGGLLDEVALYSRALTRGEIRALFNRGKADVEQAAE